MNWSLSELESIVYDFVNYNPKRDKALDESRFRPLDVQKEDLMNIQKIDKKKAEEQPLPQMIREYILHDRGNSIFLGDSFANLPSPVGEGQTIKNLFRFSEDDDDGKKLEREKEKEKNEIKIEGKPDKNKKEPKNPEKNDLNMIDIAEIDKIVFEATALKNGKDGRATNRQQFTAGDRNNFTEKEKAERNGVNDPYQDLQKTQLHNSLGETVNPANHSVQYQEEDSYINPSNVSKVNQSGFNDMNLDVLQNVSILQGMSNNNSVDHGKRMNPNDSNPYISKQSQKALLKRGNQHYDNINNSNMLIDGGDGL